MCINTYYNTRLHNIFAVVIELSFFSHKNMVKHLINKTQPLKFIVFLVLFAIAVNINAQPAGKPLSEEAKKGEDLFKKNCASCHSMNAKMTGPALAGVANKRSEEWLLKWIKNNVKLRESGDADAIAVYNENGKAAMNTFENLSDDQIKSIILYTKEWTPKETPKVLGEEKEPGFYNNNTYYILLFLIVVLIIVYYILRKTRKTLSSTLSEGDSSDKDNNKPSAFKSKLAELKKRSNPTIVALAVGSIIAGGLATYGFYFGVTEVAVQQGYAPEQPIKFSHKIHAGDYKIDCKYCHSTVEKSKQASVPSVNTCMNCHKGVQLRDKYDGQISPEIKKIYAALDYDPEKPAGEQFGPNPKPIRWVRIHNLPDHAFFNHSHHVKTVGLTCQTCHGPVQNMEVVQQYSTLQMGWCINCHRERNIDVENNPYYEKLHAKIKAEKNNKNSNYSKYFVNGKINVKAADNGALECSKCHY